MASARAVHLRLLRACAKTFRGDAETHAKALAEIRSHFRKNAHLTDPGEVQQALSSGLEAANFIANYIVQGTLNERGNLVVRPQTTLKDITITPDPLTESDEGCKRH